MLMLRLMEQLEVVGMREKVIEVSDYFDVTLACKDGERMGYQFPTVQLLCGGPFMAAVQHANGYRNAS